MTQEFSPVEIERLRGLLDGKACDGILGGDFTPLTKVIINAPIPDQLRLPKVTLFDGTGNPTDIWESIPCGHALKAILTHLSVSSSMRPSQAKPEGGGIDYQPTPSRVGKN